MAPTKYDNSRTLVRPLCRLPGEDLVAYKEKVRLLRTHFEQDNTDTAELCQWFMGLRKRFGPEEDPVSFGILGDFLLEPRLRGFEDTDENTRDRWRRDVFDHVAGFGPDAGRPLTELAEHPCPEALTRAIERAAAEPFDPANTTAVRLFARLGTLHPSHRLVLCKSAAEWIVARYQRGMENWVRQHEEWNTERQAWEEKHPGLTPELRERFTSVFRQLRVNRDETEAAPEDADTRSRDIKTGVRRKNPRICPWERLRLNTKNCWYAGQKGHGPLCWKFTEFLKARQEENRQFNKKAFKENASRLARLCQERNITKPSILFLSPSAADLLFKDMDKPKRDSMLSWFKGDWQAYLKFLDITQETAVEQGRLPHCLAIGHTFEKSECLFNPHTALCTQYHRLLTAEFGNDSNALTLEGLYRDWRSLYLSGPRKPSFKYPSAKDLPMPKVFGAGFFELDMARSVLRLRMENMAKGEWIEVGFTPWPRGYSPSRDEAADRVTSVHVQFVGNRVRLGFHFRVENAPSRFGCSQDELDELRSRRYPRQAQDKDFLKSARLRLLDSFTETRPERCLRMLTVDMGMSGAHVAIFDGTRPVADEPLRINKLERLYATFPGKDTQSDKRRKHGMKGKKGSQPAPDDRKPIETRGLRKEHVGKHLAAIAEGAATLAEHRAVKEEETVSVLHGSDFRGLKRHIAWMAKDWTRLNAKQIIDCAEKHRCDLIVFESLRGHRMPGFDKLGADSDRKKQEQLLYAYGRVRQKVKEKAVERGMRVVTVPYFKSSRVCAACGRLAENQGLWRKNKNKKKFICEHKGCKKEVNSDANAARVLGRVFWGEIVLPDPE